MYISWATHRQKSIFAFHFRHVFFTLHAFLEFTEANKTDDIKLTPQK